MEIMEKEKFINEYNEICKKHLSKGSLLSDLTDHELYIWIVGRTYQYGRSLEDSLKNAESHLKNRENAERLFARKHTDILSF